MTQMAEISKGFAALEKYTGCAEVQADHDIIWAGPQSEDGNDDCVADEDRVLLEKLGWHFDEEVGRWAVNL